MGRGGMGMGVGMEATCGRGKRGERDGAKRVLHRIGAHPWVLADGGKGNPSDKIK